MKQHWYVSLWLNISVYNNVNSSTLQRWFVNGNITCFTGGHLPLALLAIILLILSISIIPISAMVAVDMVPKVSFHYSHYLVKGTTWPWGVACVTQWWYTIYIPTMTIPIAIAIERCMKWSLSHLIMPPIDQLSSVHAVISFIATMACRQDAVTYHAVCVCIIIS